MSNANWNPPEWLVEWYEANGLRHRTINYIRTFVCPVVEDEMDRPNYKKTKFCPLCGKELGKYSIKFYKNVLMDDIVWEN